MALLPLELLQLILENLHSHHEDLKSCTLVSRAWLASSQTRLFDTIIIENRSQCHYLYKHLVRWPHITPYIHHLSIRISCSPDRKPEPQTLLLLTHLQSLSLYLDWQKITPELRDALIITLQRPMLTTLLIHRSFFDWDGDLPNILRHSVNLKRLSLSGILCMRQDSGTDAVQQKTRIDDLTISPEYNSSSALSEWIINPHCSLDLSALRSVHITDCDRFNQGLPSCILKLAGSSLTRFSFKSTARLSREWRNSTVEIDFSNNPSLRYLAFSFPIDTITKLGVGPPEWLERALATLAPGTYLEKIQLSFLVPAHDLNAHAEIPSWDYSAWRRLASILCSKQLPVLRHVNVVFAYDVAKNVHLGLNVLKEKAEREMGELSSMVDFGIEGRHVEEL